MNLAQKWREQENKTRNDSRRDAETPRVRNRAKMKARHGNCGGCDSRIDRDEDEGIGLCGLASLRENLLSVCKFEE
jgi:hypothetical protein